MVDGCGAVRAHGYGQQALPVGASPGAQGVSQRGGALGGAAIGRKTYPADAYLDVFGGLLLRLHKAVHNVLPLVGSWSNTGSHSTVRRGRQGVGGGTCPIDGVANHSSPVMHMLFCEGLGEPFLQRSARR